MKHVDCKFYISDSLFSGIFVCISLIAYVTVKKFSVMSRQLLGRMAEVSC